MLQTVDQLRRESLRSGRARRRSRGVAQRRQQLLQLRGARIAIAGLERFRRQCGQFVESILRGQRTVSRQLLLEQRVVAELRFQRVDRAGEVGDGGGNIEPNAFDAQIVTDRGGVNPAEMQIGQEAHAGQREAGIEQGPLLNTRMRRVDQVIQQVGQPVGGVVLGIQAALARQAQLLQQGDGRHRRLRAIAPEQTVTVGFVEFVELIRRVAFGDDLFQRVFGGSRDGSRDGGRGGNGRER